MFKKLLAAVLAIITMMSAMSVGVFADSEYIPKGVRETQKQYENLISVAIENSEYKEEQIDIEHIFIVEHTSPMQMRKNETPLWIYVALPIADTSDISYAHFNESEYVSAITNFAALKGTENPCGNELQAYINANNLSEPSEITNLWIGEGVHIFAHKMACNDEEYVIPYYLKNDSVFNRIKNEDCNIEIGKAYTLDDFLDICERAAELFDESRKSENKQDKSETFVDNEDNEVTSKPEQTQKPDKDIEIADKITNEEEKTDGVTYVGVPNEKWDFANGEFTESFNGVSSAEGRGYSSKYFSAKADKIYYLELSNVTANGASGTITFTVINKNNGMISKTLNYDDMVHSYSPDGSGGDSFGAALEFRADNDFYFEITTSNPQSAKFNGTYSVREADLVHFNDITGHWAENTINKWADKGIISGYPDGTFKPDNPVTRAELAKILTIAFDLQPSEYVYNENDLNENDWYYNYLLCAGNYIPNYALPEINEKNQPYIDNRTVNAFLPQQCAMRMHVAETLVEIIRNKNKMIDDVPDITVVKDELNKTFKDADYEDLLANHGMIPENVRRMFEYTYLANKLSIMQGDPDGYFRPYDYVTRAELITMIDRVIGIMEW